MDEPSVLDLVKARLAFWKADPPGMPRLKDLLAAEDHLHPPAAPEPPPASPRPVQSPEPAQIEAPRPSFPSWPWPALLAVILAVRQGRFEPPHPQPLAGLVLYLFAAGALFLAIRRGEIVIADPPATCATATASPVRRARLITGLTLAVVAFVVVTPDHVTWTALVAWLTSILLVSLALVDGPQGWLRRWLKALGQDRWSITLTRWHLVVALVIVTAVLFRCSNLGEVPAEMTGQHAELLLDEHDVLDGKSGVYFPRDNGRPGLLIVSAAAVSLLAGATPSFLGLKVVGVAFGILALLLIYSLGVETSNRRAGLAAALLAGIAYWPNVLGRVALPSSTTPLLAAAALAALFRASVPAPGPRSWSLAWPSGSACTAPRWGGPSLWQH